MVPTSFLSIGRPLSQPSRNIRLLHASVLQTESTSFTVCQGMDYTIFSLIYIAWRFFGNSGRNDSPKLGNCLCLQGRRVAHHALYSVGSINWLTIVVRLTQSKSIRCKWQLQITTGTKYGTLVSHSTLARCGRPSHLGQSRRFGHQRREIRRNGARRGTIRNAS